MKPELRTPLYCPGCRTAIEYEGDDNDGEWNCDEGCGEAWWVLDNPRFSHLAEAAFADLEAARIEQAMANRYEMRTGEEARI